MLKPIYRAYYRPDQQDHGYFYGFALEAYLEAFLEENPEALRCSPISVTAQQLAEWKCTGRWEDDWKNKAFIRAGTLLRWRLDEPDPDISSTTVWDTAHMSITDIRKSAGLTQANMATRFEIAKRTIENWDSGVSKCPIHTRLMMAELLGLIERP